MSNLEKEVKDLISRFDAAKDAFMHNTADVKQLAKEHKKELKAANAAAKSARVEVEALKAELAILQMELDALKGNPPAPAETTAAPKAKAPKAPKAKAKGKRGRPKKTATPVAAEEETATTEAPAAPVTRGRGRPKKDPNAAPAAKGTRSAGRPKKDSAPAATGTRGRGRPRKNAVTAADAVMATDAPETETMATEAPAPVKSTRGRKPGAAKKTAGAKKPAGAKKAGRPAKEKLPASPLQAIVGVGPTMAAQFEAAGVKTPSAMSKLSNAKMTEILNQCGPRYRNPTPDKLAALKAAAAEAK